MDLTCIEVTLQAVGPTSTTDLMLDRIEPRVNWSMMAEPGEPSSRHTKETRWSREFTEPPSSFPAAQGK